MQRKRIKRFSSLFSFFLFRLCVRSSLSYDDNGNDGGDYGGGDKGLLHVKFFFKKNDFILTFPVWIFFALFELHPQTHAPMKA